MATMNISLPDPMKKWVESQSDDGSFSNASDYVRDLIRRDQIRKKKIAHVQKLIDESYASGISERSMNDVVSEGRAIAAKRKSSK